MKNYDVIVIGSGIGGLSSALRLSIAGKKALVLEQHNLPGGCASSFVRGRFEFDASLHELCGVGEPGNWGYAGKLIMEDYGLPYQWFYSNELYRVIARARSGKVYDVTLPCGVEACAKKMEEYVPGSYGPMMEYFSIAKECYEASQYFDRHMWERKNKDGSVKVKATVFIKRFMRYLMVSERPFNEVLRRIHMPEDAIDIINTYWVYLGSDLDSLSFISMGVMMYCYVEMKPAIPYHTSHAISVEAIEKIKSCGGDIFHNVKANKVVSDEKGHVIGVDTTIGFIPCEHIIANVNPATAYGQLLDKRIRVPKREQKKLNSMKFSLSFVNVYLGLNKSCEELGIKNYTTFCPDSLYSTNELNTSKKLDNFDRCTAVCYNVIYPDCSPKGTCIMTLTIPFSGDLWGTIDQRDYIKTKEKVCKQALAHYEKLTGIDIAPYIEEIEIATPWTFAHYLGTPQGVVYGNHNDGLHSIGIQLQTIRKDQPIKGFKTTGASGARGDGYSQSFGSGNDIANLTLEEMNEKRRRNRRGK